MMKYFYWLSFAGFFIFLSLGFSAPRGGLSASQQELLTALQSWDGNAQQLKNYVTSSEFKTDTPAVRFEKYNQFSSRNNSLMMTATQTAFAKEHRKVFNLLADLSNDYVAYLDSAKHFIESRKEIKASLPDRKLKDLESQINTEAFNLSQIYFILSGLFLFSGILHLLHSNNKSQKQQVALESQVETFKKVIGNMTEGVIVTNKYGQFTFVNEPAKQIVGAVVNDILYPSSIDVIGFHSMDGRKLIKEELPMHTALKKVLVNDQEVFVKNQQHPEGIFVSCSNGYYVDDKGLTAGSVVVLKNITHKKQMEQFWKSEKERALENSKLKSDFLASMSHEIRTPMNAVLGLTTLLKETKLNADQKDYVLTIQRSAKSLLTLINDILDHSKIEAGKLDINNAPFNLKTLAKDIADNFKPLVMEKNIEFKLNFEKLEHEHFNSDSNRIRQIMINLIGNAIKFTKSGYVEVIFESIDKNTKFTIKDTGSGMTPVEVSHLFQKYFQTKNGQTVGGTGLGLNICKQLVDLLKGEIGVTSELGKGTQFWFSLPLERCEAVSEDLHNENVETQLFTNQFSGTVLIAEDSTVNQKVITNYLTKLGLQFLIANNGEEAVKMYQEHLPDLILMDSNMPVMDGLQATKEILKLQATGLKKTPIVGLSADVRQTNFDENKKAGMSAFLTKPIELSKLVAELKNHFTATQATPSQLEKIKSLMVGDQLLIEVLLADFTSTAEAKLQTLEKSQSHEEIYQTAHALKSAAAELDAHDFHKVLQSIELKADKKEDAKSEITKAIKMYPETVSLIQEKINAIKSQQRKAS